MPGGIGQLAWLLIAWWLVAHRLSPVAAQAAALSACQAAFNFAHAPVGNGRPFPGTTSDAALLAGFHLVTSAQNMTNSTLISDYGLCLSYFTPNGDFTARARATIIEIRHAASTRVYVPEYLPHIPDTMPACYKYYSRLFSDVQGWMNTINPANLATMADMFRLLEFAFALEGLDFSACESELWTATRSTNSALQIFAVQLGYIHDAKVSLQEWLLDLQRFAVKVDNLNQITMGLDQLWGVLPSVDNNWRGGNGSNPTNHSSVYYALTESMCAAWTWLRPAYCGVTGIGTTLPVDVAACSIIPSKQTRLTTASASKYLTILTNSSIMEQQQVQVFKSLLQLAVSTTEDQLRNCSHSHTELATVPSHVNTKTLANTTRCLNLLCIYPFTNTSDPSLYDVTVFPDVSATLKEIGLVPVNNIRSLHQCGRSCLRVLTFEEDAAAITALIITYLVMAGVLAAYIYAFAIIIYNWKTVIDVLHWRSLLYINTTLLVDFIITRMRAFEYTKSLCHANGIALLETKWTLAPWQCRASAAGREILHILFPLFTFWQAFIWFSYIRRVTGMRLSASSNKRWNLQMRVCEISVLLAAFLIAVLPFAMGSYTSLHVDGAPLGLPCTVVAGSPFKYSNYIGLVLHSGAFSLLVSAWFFFVKSSVVKKRVWKIPIIGSSWMSTTGSVRASTPKKQDADTVMRQTQNRIAVFMIFVVLYQIAILLKNAIRGRLVTDQEKEQFSREFEDAGNCVIFSCQPELCQTKYSFTRQVENYHWPDLMFNLMFGAFATCLLSFVSYPGFSSPFKCFRRTASHESTHHNSRQDSEAKEIVATSASVVTNNTIALKSIPRLSTRNASIVSDLALTPPNLQYLANMSSFEEKSSTSRVASDTDLVAGPASPPLSAATLVSAPVTQTELVADATMMCSMDDEEDKKPSMSESPRRFTAPGGRRLSLTRSLLLTGQDYQSRERSDTAATFAENDIPGMPLLPSPGKKATHRRSASLCQVHSIGDGSG